ncbi:MAG: tRNA1(Val) (adenine(37)-N6)-methyltransferase [Syntrophales bacterium]
MMTEKEETLDDLLGGKLRIIQKKKGYRFSIDAILLAQFVRLGRGDRIIDMGTGSGVISMILASRSKDVWITGLEIQDDLAEMAKRSVAINCLEDRVEIRTGDVRHIGDLFAPFMYDTVVFNPPYRKVYTGRLSRDMEKAVARHEIRGTLGDFLSAASYLLKPSGRAYLIYTAARAAGLFYRMREAGIEPKRMRIVHSSRSTEGEFILMEGLKGGGEELLVMPPLFIYDEAGEYTVEMKAIFEGIHSPLSFS